MISRDWQNAIALTPIVIMELETLRDFFWLVGQIDGATFTAQLNLVIAAVRRRAGHAPEPVGGAC